MPSFIKSVRSCIFDKYATFSGRAGRFEFWSFIIFVNIVDIIVSVSAEYIDKAEEILRGDVIIYLIYCLFLCLIALALVVPSISVSVRRLHDVGYSGSWCWLILLPVFGPIWLLVLFILPSEPFKNKYDEDFVEPEETRDIPSMEEDTRYIPSMDEEDTRHIPSMEEDVKDMNY
ncbi:MAG: DUF805 domain-containing protein [Paludibacteraceae bacterium]|nr:DUF805 domain-containing protein [Paludibacteraceae bacterium]